MIKKSSKCNQKSMQKLASVRNRFPGWWPGGRQGGRQTSPLKVGGSEEKKKGRKKERKKGWCEDLTKVLHALTRRVGGLKACSVSVAVSGVLLYDRKSVFWFKRGLERPREAKIHVQSFFL